MPRTWQRVDGEHEHGRPAASTSTTAGGKILLVDDDQDLIDVLGLHLRLAGFTPLAAFTPAGALERAEYERPDLVLLDVELGPWSGLDVLEALRARSEVPVVMLTGCASERVEAQSFELGADAYLQKPISTRSLIVHIRAVLSRYARAREQTEVHVQLNVALRELVEARDRALAAAGRATRIRDEHLALAAHDLLEPLTVITSLAQLHRGSAGQPGTPAGDPILQALAEIEAHALQMARQLIELLSGTHLEIGQVVELRRTRTALSAAAHQLVAAPQQSQSPQVLRSPARRYEREPVHPNP